MISVQCYGVTKKGQRCKISVQNGEKYCHYHVNQGTSMMKKSIIKPATKVVKTSTKGYTQREYQRGFIYVYTLKHLVDKSPRKEDWLQVKKLPKINSDEASWKVFNPKKYTLIKVGLTTGTVTQRLKQWEAKCNHSLIYLEPSVNYHSRSLTNLFSSLKLSNKSDLHHYDALNHGFFTERNLARIERTIHETLWKLYGKGDIVCHGCTNENSTRGHGIHVEWFMIKRKELANVFRVIDDVCEVYNKLI